MRIGIQQFDENKPLRIQIRTSNPGFTTTFKLPHLKIKYYSTVKLLTIQHSVPVDMVPGRPVVQSIETKVELLEELDPVLRLHDRVMVGLHTSSTTSQD